MSRILYFDCFNGASGDMVLGALLDAGLPLDELRRALGSLALDGAAISATRVLRAGVSATKFLAEEHGHNTHTHEHAHHSHEHGRAHDHDHAHDHMDSNAPAAVAHHHAHRSLAEINSLIERSALTLAAQARAKELFHRLGEAEAAIHQIPIDKIHLHEVGALDSIIDIVGAVFALEWFHADHIASSPLNVGGGMVNSAHGHFPVPAPATVKLLAGAPVYSSGVQSELVTPTGALLVTSYAKSYGPVPAMTISQVGYGAGDRDLPNTPNVLRVLVGDTTDQPHTEHIVVLQSELDDMNPQLFGLVMERLYAAGALEVYFASVQMKKNRPGTLLTVLARPEQREELSAIVFRETTTIGVRYHEVMRERLEREIVPVDTPLGTVRFKVAKLGDTIVNASPEFEDCLRIASERHVPLKDVQGAANKAYLDTRND
ncbi:MAG TPA: nickel pincer cofactor biosynthesis protein LarC [Vicinamibacterales bacterium]|nr:nickel pincer cofactor biosynthesis protein LarC [Vicinamibacterales bacterium]